MVCLHVRVVVVLWRESNLLCGQEVLTAHRCVSQTPAAIYTSHSITHFSVFLAKQCEISYSTFCCLVSMRQCQISGTGLPRHQMQISNSVHLELETWNQGRVVFRHTNMIPICICANKTQPMIWMHLCMNSQVDALHNETVAVACLLHKLQKASCVIQPQARQLHTWTK